MTSTTNSPSPSSSPAPSADQAHETSRSAHASVLWAMLGNTVVMISKLVAFLITGSGSMLAESIHSLADVLNQSLLYLGLKRADRRPDEARARGYGREQFVWALISAVGIFFLGCGVTLYHGAHHLLHPPTHEASAYHFKVSVIVLGLSLLVEGWVFWVALRSARAQAEGRPLMKYLKSDADPTLLAVLLEDGAACLGIIFAFCGIALTHITGLHIWDTLGTLIIGGLLGVIAVWLIRINATLLVGRGLKPESVAQVRGALNELTYIEEIDQLHSESIGANRFELHLDLDFDESELVKQIPLDLSAAYREIKSEGEFVNFCHHYGAEAMRVVYRAIDQVEEQIKAEVDEVDYIDVEPR